MMGPIKECRMCMGDVESVLELSATPIANAFSYGPDNFALMYPLGLCQCVNCGHVQIGFNIEGSYLFTDYKYQTPEAERSRLAECARNLAVKYPHALRVKNKGGKSGEMPKVLEIGSNNGIYINELNKAGFFSVGVDPSPHAPKTGMPKWFTSRTAKQIANSMGKMQLILANNVFAHVDDLRNVLLGVKYLLAEDGRLIFEVQYLPALIRGGMFDMIYHEHKDYHTLKPWVTFLGKFGMCVREVEHLPTHGGSVRVTAGFGSDGIKVSDPAINWENVGIRIEAGKAKFMEELNGYQHVAAFGATAKATTLLHHYGITDRISYMVDETPSKIGRYMPGTEIPIYGFDKLQEDKPDAVVITAWNYAEVIKPRLHGIKTIVPFSNT